MIGGKEYDIPPQIMVNPTPEERTRAMGFHIPANWRDVVRFTNPGPGFTTPPVVTFENGQLICDGWDFGGDA